MRQKDLYTQEVINDYFKAWQNARIGSRHKEWLEYVDVRDGYKIGYHFEKHCKQYGIGNSEPKSLIIRQNS